ncbi:MAG: TPM domain-containing protein [Butyrivibrio sp.]|nr:TPM domain-containing protein [Butyrivibrio sp.]
MKKIKKSLQQFFNISLLLLILMYMIPFTSLASDYAVSGTTIPSTRQVERLVDDADLLTASEEEALLNTLNTYSEATAMDICILTVNDRNGADIQSFADDYYDYNGLGIGEDRSGIVLVISMEDRSWALSTCGEAIEAFSDSDQEYIMDDVLEDLSYGDYYPAFSTYAFHCEEEITSYRNSFVGDSGLRKSDITLFIVLIIVALILPLIPLVINISMLNNIAFKPDARDYMKGNLSVKSKQDRFLSHHLRRVPIPKETRSSGGGGSSVHISSSGTSHGGSSGHF